MNMSFGGKDATLYHEFHLEQLNKYFALYNLPSEGLSGEKILHFTAKQLLSFPNLLNIYHSGTSSISKPHNASEQFEQFYNNVQLLQDLKVTCSGDSVADLQFFRSLKNLHLVGPNIGSVKGLRSASSNLTSVIVEKGIISLNELISSCCMDESGPMSWPCLIALQVSHCSLALLDSSLKLLPCLQELDLSFNKLTAISNELCYLDHLTHLNLSFNRLTEVPQIRGGARWRLQCLHLAYNEIASLEGLASLENLRHLDLSYNLFTQHNAIQPLRYMLRLENLSLNGNPLSFHKKHRLLSLQSISPTAIKPDFILDGKSLTNGELKAMMYTPTAVTLLPTVINADLSSINTVEPECYDVSMSSAVGVSRKQREDVRRYGTRSQSLKSRYRPTQPVSSDHLSHTSPLVEGELRQQNEDNETVGTSREFSLEFEKTGVENLSGSQGSFDSSSIATPIDFENDSEELSIVSAMSQPGFDDAGQSVTASPVSCQDEDSGKRTTSDEYLSPEDESNVYDSELGGEHAAPDDCQNKERRHSATTSDSKTSETDTLIGEDEDENVTPPLHVKRRMALSSADNVAVLSGPEEVYLAATHNHLVEQDIETGKAWERLELSTVTDVSLLSAGKVSTLEVKFAYLRKDRRTRLYTVLDVGAEEATNLLFRELESVVSRNRSMQNRNFVCLKCSQAFTAEVPAEQNSALDSYALHTAPASPGGIYGLSQTSDIRPLPRGVICSCGSDMVVETEGRPSANSLFTVDEDECREATESTVNKARKPLFKSVRSASVNITKPNNNVDASMSWIHSFQSISNVNHTFAKGECSQISKQNEHHLSGSLPNDLCSILMKPGIYATGRLDPVSSVPAFHQSEQAATPFKTFSHLLTPHDLYKLVDVTPAVNVHTKDAADKNAKREMSTETNYTPQGTANFSTFAGLQQYEKITASAIKPYSGRQLVTTSTPRRRASVPLPVTAHSVDSNTKAIEVEGSFLSREAKKRRALNFDRDEGINSRLLQSCEQFGPIEYYEWDEPETEETFKGGEQSQFGIPMRLKHFIEEELLEAEEEICAAVQTQLVSQTGENIGTLASAANHSTSTPQSKRRGLFGSAKKPAVDSESFKLPEKDVLENEAQVLLLVTTENIQVLEVAGSEKISLDPESLNCMATHHLSQLIGLELGLSNCVLYFAVAGAPFGVLDQGGKSSPTLTKSSGKKSKFKLDSIEKAYAVYFRDAEKCERFYRRLIDLCRMKLDSDSRAPSTVSSANSTPVSSRAIGNVGGRRSNSLLDHADDSRCFSAYSDALEKNFSEHVLMKLDLDVPKTTVSGDRPDTDANLVPALLTEKLFVYVPCWILDGKLGREIPVGLVVSCGGSLAVVTEQRAVALHGFATALVRAQNTKLAKARANSLSLFNSFSSTTSVGLSPKSPIPLPQNAVPPLAKAAYFIKMLAKCSDLSGIVRYEDHPLCLEFNFEASKVNMEEAVWQLTFASRTTLLDMIELVKAYWEVDTNAELQIRWK